MRPSEAKPTIAYRPDVDEYCLMYPDNWVFHNQKTAPCHITLIFKLDKNEPNTYEAFYNFRNACRANGDRIGKLFLRTVGLTINTYELNECFNIQLQPLKLEEIAIEFDCLYYDQFVKPNKDVRYETYKPFQL